MTLREHDLLYWGKQEGIELGIQQGARENAIENARNFLKEGVSPEIVARCTGLALNEVHELAKDITIQ